MSNFEKMTIQELKEVLDRKGVKYAKRATKTKLIELLNEFNGNETEVAPAPTPKVVRAKGEH